MKSAVLVLGLSLSMAACAVNGDEPVQDTSAAVTVEADIAFKADGTVQSKALSPDHPIVVTFDVRRLVTCGAPAKLEMFYLTGAGHTHVELGTEWADATTVRATIGPFANGDLSLWFHTANGGGCEDWDSAHGNNYHFTIGHQNGPTYEQVAPMIQRACSGCHADAFGSREKVDAMRDAMLGRISSGSMPRNNPNWRNTPDGQAVLAYLRD